MPSEDPTKEARKHLDALKASANGARVMSASLRTMSRDLVQTVLAMKSEDRTAAYKAREKAIRLASYMSVVYEAFDDEKGEWK